MAAENTDNPNPIKLGIADRGIEGEWLSREERLANVVREVCAGMYTQEKAVALLDRLVDEYVGDALTEAGEYAD
jgi:hypothetical protein